MGIVMPFDGPEISREELARWQARRVGELATSLVPGNRFWTERFAACGVAPEDLGDPAVFRRLTPITKAELAADQERHPPYGTNLTSPVEQYARLHQTSGTTGRPMRWLDTPASWQWMLGCWEQLFAMMELSREDRLFFPFSFGPFLGFWAGFEGANRLGNLCLAGGGMSSEARLRFLADNRATVVCCTPTYALRLAEVARETGFDLAQAGVSRLLVAGEAGGNIPATRARIEREWSAQVVDHWGMTELGPLAIESPRDPGGLALLESESVVEILDPHTLEPVAEGEEGELVVTNLGRSGSPLLRYRTGDRVIARLSAVPLPVKIDGRWVRVRLQTLRGGILGRVDEMITIRGNNLYPSALEEVLRREPMVAEYRIELSESRGMQSLRIDVECDPRETDPAIVLSRLSSEIKSRWNFQAELNPATPGSLPRHELKGRRFFRRAE
jgi:phenylacetate-CoA ligase